MEQKVENEQQALNVLVQVAVKAQEKGILSLNEAVLVVSAIKMFEAPQPVEESKTDK